MEKNKLKRIVVCGATGQQGSAVLEALKKGKDFEICALLRDPENTKAKKLEEKGIKILKGDLYEKNSLIDSFKGAYGVFGVTQPWSKGYKKCFPELEIKQGLNILEASKEANLKHLVITSMIHLEFRNTGVPHLDSKIFLEDKIKESKIPYTIFKLPSFMENIGKKFFPIKKKYVRGLLEKKSKVTYISCQDIGEFVYLAFSIPENFINKEMDLIADLVSGEELEKTLSEILRRKIIYKTTPKFLLKIFAKEFYEMKLFYEKLALPPYLSKLEEIMVECKKIYPEIKTLKKYLEIKLS